MLAAAAGAMIKAAEVRAFHISLHFSEIMASI